LPPLGITEEELRHARAARDRVLQWVIGVEMPAYPHHAARLAASDFAGDYLKPPWARPRARPMKAAMIPATMMTRSSRVADIIWRTRPISRPARPVTAAMMAHTCSLLGPVLRNRPSANDSRPTMRTEKLARLSNGCG